MNQPRPNYRDPHLPPDQTLIVLEQKLEAERKLVEEEDIQAHREALEKLKD